MCHWSYRKKRDEAEEVLEEIITETPQISQKQVKKSKKTKTTCKLKNSRSWENPNKEKPKEIYTKMYCSQSSENWRQIKKKWKKQKRNTTILTWKKPTQITGNFASEIAEARAKWHNILQLLKWTWAQKSMYRENILQEQKGNQAILRDRQAKRICLQRPYHNTMAKKFSKQIKKNGNLNIRKEESTW